MIVELLLTEGADVGAKSNSGQTPLHSAAGFRTNKQVVELLMRLGADKDALTNDGQTPCDFAKAEDVRLLLCRETSSSGRALEREYLDQCVPYAAVCRWNWRQWRVRTAHSPNCRPERNGPTLRKNLVPMHVGCIDQGL